MPKTPAAEETSVLVLLLGVATANAAYDAIEHHVPFDWVWASFWGLWMVLAFIEHIQGGDD